MPKKTYREKLEGPGYPKIAPIPPKMEKRLGAGSLLIPAPWEVDELIRKVRKGKVTTVVELRAALCAKHGTDQACPIVTGISVGIAAGAAEEARAAGKKRITPYWRALKKGGELNPKLPGGVESQKRILEAEGHRVLQRGKRWFVEDLERVLFSPAF